MRLLSDIRDVFEHEERDALPTQTLLERLHAMDEAPWRNLHGKPLDAYGLAKRLAGYGVRSKNLRIGAAVVKGYERADFAETWSRYLPQPPHPSQPPEPRAGFSSSDNPATPATPATPGTCESVSPPNL